MRPLNGRGFSWPSEGQEYPCLTTIKIHTTVLMQTTLPRIGMTTGARENVFLSMAACTVCTMQLDGTMARLHGGSTPLPAEFEIVALPNCCL